MPLGALSQAWTTAASYLPDGWGIYDLQLVNRDSAGAEIWKAVAVLFDDHGVPQDSRGDEFFAVGYGPTPDRALIALAQQLSERRGSATG